MKKELLLELIGMLVNSDESNTESQPVSSMKKYNIGKMVIVRCRDAGVHYGELIDYEGRTVVIKNSRRMWRWFAKKGDTLSGCAVHGIKSESKIMTKINGDLPLLEACEIIPCEQLAIDSIGGSDEYTP